MRHRSRGLSAGVLSLVVLLVYLVLPSQQRYLDGPLQDIERVTRGQVDLEARHVLYTLVGVPVYRAWQALGYEGDAAWPLQVLNAIAGAVGVAALFLALLRIIDRGYVAALLAAAFAFSYGFWTYVEDAFYNVLSILPVLVALWLLFRTRSTVRPLQRFSVSLVLAALGALAVLGSQEHLLSVAVLGLGLWIAPDPQVSSQAGGAAVTGAAVPARTRLVSVLVYAFSLVLFLGLAYWVIAAFTVGCADLPCVANWLRPYGRLWRMFGALGWDRVPWAAWSFLGAVVPLWRGMGLRDLLGGTVTAANLLPQLALLAVCAVLLVSIVALIRRRQEAWAAHRYALVLSALWLALYVPANVWLDPFNPERWIVPLLPVLLFLAVAWRVTPSTLSATGIWVAPVPGSGVSRLSALPVAVGALLVVLLVFSANLVRAVWPDHHTPNPAILAARYAAGQMAEADIVISPLWDWTLYLESEGRRSLGLPGLSLEVAGRDPDGDRLMAEVERAARETMAAGGRVFLVDVFSYQPDDWQWIGENLGLQPSHFDALPLRLAWTFGGETVWQIESLAVGNNPPLP